MFHSRKRFRRDSGAAGNGIRRLRFFRLGLERLEDRLVLDVSLSLVLPPSSSYGLNNSLAIQYANPGPTAVPAPVLVISADKAKLWLPTDPSAGGSSLQVLATGPSGPAGTLAPGASGTIIVNFTSTTNVADDMIHFSLSQLKAGEPIDWPSLRDRMRPSYIGVDAWNAVFANFTASVGSTTDSYQAVLDADATYLAQFDEPTNDVARLVAYELNKANGVFAGPVLAGQVDGSLPTPGPALTFQREFQSSISGRYEMGTLGRGWVSNWDATAHADGQGNVTVDQSGAMRYFAKQSGGYLPILGDQGVLTALSSGVYQLAEPDGSITAFNADGTLNYVQDPHGSRITATYHGGLLSKLTASDGSFLEFTYTGGLLTGLADSAGRTSTYTYDPSGQHLLTYSDARGITAYSYVAGQGAPREHALASIALADSTHLFFGYDAAGRLVEQYRDNNQQDVSLSYSPAGGYSVTDAEGHTSRALLDDSGQVRQTVDPLGNVTEYTYNASGNLTQVDGPQRTRYVYAYDTRGNLTSATDPLGLTTAFAYNASNDLTGFTDPKGNTTSYDYDGAHNLASITYPDLNRETFTYNSLGQSIRSVNANGKAIGYTYNAQGLVETVSFADDSSYTYHYDSRGKLQSAADTAGTTWFRYQDSANPDLLTEIDYPNGQFLKFIYNRAGQREKSVDQTGFTVNYAYDALARLQKLTDAGGNLIVQYTYSPAGRLIQKDNGGGTRTTYTYDDAGNVLSIVNLAPDHVAVNSFDRYTYDALGNIATDTNQNGQWTYTYDADGQLTRAVFAPNASNPDGLMGQDLRYVYDAAGNRLSATVNGVATTYVANPLNEYTSSTTSGVTTTYQYDKAGNLVAQASGGSTTTYTFNDLSQLTAVDGPDLTARYTYDPLGRRNSETVNGNTTRFLLDPFGLGDVASEYTGTGDLLAHYTYGFGLASRVSSGGSAAYYDFNLTGSTVGLTGPAGSYINKYSYLPFGQTTTVTAGLPNRFTFVGEFGVSQDGSGLAHMGFRSYDPATGRFVSNDPLGLGGGDANLRRYVQNSPISSVDPLGLSSLSVSGPFWKWRKLVLMDQLQKHIAGGPHDAFPWLKGSGSYSREYDRLAANWDDPYFHEELHNRDSFIFEDGSFRGEALTGHQVNYYFQGMAAAAYGRSLGQLKTRVILYYQKHRQRWDVWNDKDFDQRLAKALLAATEGWQNFQSDLRYWREQTAGGTKNLPKHPAEPAAIVEGVTVAVLVGNLIWSANPQPPASAFTAKTEWSDGVTTTGTMVRVDEYDGATYEAYATRIFPDPGAYAVTGTTTIVSPDRREWKNDVAEIVADAPLMGSPVNFSVPAGRPYHYHGPIATFQDLDPQADAKLSDFHVDVAYGRPVETTIESTGGGSYVVIGDLDFDFDDEMVGEFGNLQVRISSQAGGPVTPYVWVYNSVPVVSADATLFTTSVFGRVIQASSAAPYSGELALIETTDPRITSASQVTVTVGDSAAAAPPAGYAAAAAADDTPVLVTGKTLTRLPGGVIRITVYGIVNALTPGSGPAAAPLKVDIEGQPAWTALMGETAFTAQIGVNFTESQYTVNPVSVAAYAGKPVQDVPVATIAGPADGNYSAAIAWGDGENSSGQIIALGGGLFRVLGSKPHPYSSGRSQSITITVSGPGMVPTMLTQSPVTILAAKGPSLPGLYAPDRSTFFLRESQSGGDAEHVFVYGVAGVAWMELVGDWNGDGQDTPGMYDPATATFYLTDRLEGGDATYTFNFGIGGQGWKPLVGDWNGDGKDSIAIYEPATSLFFFKNTLAGGDADEAVQFGVGSLGWIPIAGDWDGLPGDGFGFYEPAISAFWLKNARTSGPAEECFQFGMGSLGWTVLAGDWDGLPGDGVGFYVPHTAQWFLKNEHAPGPAEVSFTYGVGGAGWRPLVGCWQERLQVAGDRLQGEDSRFKVQGSSALAAAPAAALDSAAVDRLDLVALAAQQLPSNFDNSDLDLLFDGRSDRRLRSGSRR